MATDPELLVALPLYCFVEKKEPFDSWLPEASEARTWTTDLYRAAGAGYAFYYYYVLVYKQFGVDVATTVRALHIKRLNLAANGFGDELSKILEAIERGIECNARQPTLPTRPDVEVPAEFHIAMALLTSSTDGPYHSLTQTSAQQSVPPEIMDDAMNLAEHLIHARDKAFVFFRNALEQFSIEARELHAWLSKAV